MLKKDSFMIVRKLHRHPDVSVSYTRFWRKTVWRKRKRITEQPGPITYARFCTESGKFSDDLLVEFAYSNPGVELQVMRKNPNQGPLVGIHLNGRKKIRFPTGTFESEGKLCCKNRHEVLIQLAEFI